MIIQTDLPAHFPDELFTTLLQAPGVQIERIVSHGHQSSDGFWYDQPTGEWVIVLKGAAKIELEGRTVEMGPGDYLDIPAHTKHRVAWTVPDEPTIWLAVHYEGGSGPQGLRPPQLLLNSLAPPHSPKPVSQ